MLDGGGDATLLVPRGDDNREELEPSSGLGLRRVWHFLFLPYPNWEAGGAEQLGFDKKMKSAEHFVATKRWVGKVRPAAVICVEWIQSAGRGEREPYCEMTQLQQ